MTHERIERLRAALRRITEGAFTWERAAIAAVAESALTVDDGADAGECSTNDPSQKATE